MRLDLEAGTYALEPGADDAIVVTWSAGPEASPRVRLEGSGNRAVLVVAHTPHQGFRVRVQVPSRCDLHVHLTAGDLKIGPIEGNKDISMRAGDLRVAVPHPEAYGSVQASLWAGNIHAGAFGGEKGGLFRSFAWQGTGPYGLRVSTWAGDVTLAP